ncbi:MAG TPA: PQQ-binding-like beta-propeller repeat protein [Acetobacteraceae bacterium]|nr:PQQ-binding-like beta-propeller repeat protein [Acetobacteraceae bacterium]
MRCLRFTALFLSLSLTAQAQDWPAYGGDAAGTRYSAATEITPSNVGRLAPAWTFHTGEAPRSGSAGSAFDGGGVNWGGGAFDPKSGLFVVNVSNLAHVIRLIPRADYAAARANEPKAEIGRGLGTPYAAERTLLTSIFGIPCNPPPWGMLAAIDLSDGTTRWQVPLGSWVWGRLRGLPNEGGPIVTAGGLVFIAAAMDDKLHAFDLATGALLWEGALPAGGQATPMTYVAGGRQFVVVAADGHARMGTKLGDAVVAFALPSSR